MSTQTVNQTVTNTQTLPIWYQSYLQDVMGRATGAAAEPYQAYGAAPIAPTAPKTPDPTLQFSNPTAYQTALATYNQQNVAYQGQLQQYQTAKSQWDALTPAQQAQQGERVAPLTADQQNAYQGVRDAQGITGPAYAAAGQGYGALSGIDFAGAAGAGDGNISAGIGQLAAAGQRDTASAAQPYAQQGAGLINQSTQGSGLAAAQPYLNASTAPTGLAAASPYLSAASAGATPGAISAYMNPYNQAVTDQIATLGARNLSENILPQIGDQFVSAGQYGSQRQGVLDDRALRDTQANILAQQGQVLQQGYTQAGQLAQGNAQIQAGIGSTYGGLGTAQQQALLGAGQAAGQLSSADLARLQSAGVDIGQLGLGLSSAQSADASRQLAAGQSIGNLGVQQGQLGLSAAQAQANALYSGAQGQQSLGAAQQDAALRGSAALETAGQAQQNQTQQNLNTAYSDFTDQRDYDKNNVGFLSNVVQGLPVNTSSSGTSSTTSPGPSTAGQIAGIGLGVAGLANSGLFKSRGGAVKKPKRNASYGVMPKRGIAIAEAA